MENTSYFYDKMYFFLYFIEIYPSKIEKKEVKRGLITGKKFKGKGEGKMGKKLALLWVTVLLCGMFCIRADAAEEKEITITFHYSRNDQNYDRWSLWLWGDEIGASDNAFHGIDEYGAYFNLTVDENVTQIGYIVRTPEWEKDVYADRFVDVTEVTSGNIDVFLKEGVEEAEIRWHDNVVTTQNGYSLAEFERAYTYQGDDLGANWTEQKTTFKVWAPTANTVKLCLYRSGDSSANDLAEEIQMNKGEKGVWSAEKTGNQHGVYYTYKVTFDSGEVEAVDPYAKAAGINGDRSMVINLDSTDPAGWGQDGNPNQGANQTDAIIYELSVRDFSIDASSGVSQANRGKYLAFTEHGTHNSTSDSTGIDYLKELGVTHIQLMPIQDFSYLDEKNPTTYNWGYATKNFNVPEGSYSSNPYDGAVRIAETKQMIKALHDNGMSVVMDVVYNHVFSASEFGYNQIVPNYFTRISSDGVYSNGSYCGNDTASERSMVRKYIVDSILYWAEEYHVDGFRFDLAGVLDTETINEIVAEVKKVNPSIILYGEGWTMPTVSTKSETIFATQENASQTPNFGYFDDRIRYRIKGNSNDNSGGYVTMGVNASDIRLSVQGNAGWTQNPLQIINYVSCHDDATLWDKIRVSSGGDYNTQIRQNKLASAIIFASQGTAFMHAGEEMLRSKADENGNIIYNSYQSSDYVNSIKWNDLAKTEINELSEYYKGLISFRKSHPALRMTDAGQISANLSFIDNASDNVVAYVINGENVSGESAQKILIAFNPNSTTRTITLPDGAWDVYVNGERAGNTVINNVSGTLTLEGYSAYMLVLDEQVASGDIFAYQDINYGGAVASLGLGNYNLTDLQAKGLKNDDLSSIKCPWGYKVTLYTDDNFGGATKVITADTPWIGSDWNDVVSSIKVEKARYRIVNRYSGLCLDVAGANTENGTNVQQWTSNGTAAQIWEVSFNSDDSTYVITSTIHGKAIDMEGWSTENGGNVHVWDNYNAANQRWYINSVDNGYCFLMNKHSNKCLEVSGWSTIDGGNVQQWDYLEQTSQQWLFEMVN